MAPVLSNVERALARAHDALLVADLEIRAVIDDPESAPEPKKILVITRCQTSLIDLIDQVADLQTIITLGT